MAKLSKDDKRQIVIQYVAGATYRELAKKYGVSPAAISKILNEQKSKQKLTEVDNIVNAENTSNQKKPTKKTKHQWEDENVSGYCLDCCHYVKGGICSKSGKWVGALWQKKCFE